MADSNLRTSLPGRLTSRRGAWIALAIGVLVVVCLFGIFRGSEASLGNDQAPIGSESARVSALLDEFPQADQQPVLVVATRDDGAALTPENLTSLEDLMPTLAGQVTGEPTGPVPSDDGKAAVVIVPITVGEDNTATSATIKELRAVIGDHAPDGLTLQVTGGPAFGADVAAAFDGADFTLLLVTIVIVAVLLIITYRSPILWLIPLVVIAVADGLAGSVTAAAGAAWDLQFDSGIVSVLVFGAGTNYALLLISRYREELYRTDDDRAALATAWRGTLPAIVASNITVVLALATLLLAVMPTNRGLGIPAAIGLLLALGAVLFILPPVLAICGRRVFWPFIPRPGENRDRGRVWRGIASRVVNRPVASVLAGAALLAVMASGLFGTSVGLDQLEKFSVRSESAAGLETLSDHFPPGEAQPIWVVTRSDRADEVVAAAQQVQGVVRAHPAGTTTDGTLTKVMVTSEFSPGTRDSLDQITTLRQSVHAVSGADAQVGGAVATDLDARNGNQRDLLVVAPLILLVSFLVLTVLLRSLVAPVLLLMITWPVQWRPLEPGPG